ncbi:hypothetical protein [Paraburkholderia sp. BL10I2N1]|uniref:hypothetical protein n=1 Tax=Paraburkholderia sp. BL10I2N1 TaxID=1938796 RepID=UPI0010622304|nr:hypothetical protein [Paraburkholderia sp. BL10I2N1]TDN61620.1 hypothetical protein B0G77_5098 [Paraburkholderia sp. BL10I2N1]
MFDGFWSGMVGGLFGPAFVRWAGKYKYWTIFLVVTIGVHVFLFAHDLFDVGIRAAIARVVKLTFTPVGFFVPAGVGLLAVVIIAFCSAITPKESDEK